MKAILLAFLLQLDAIGAVDPTVFDLSVLAAIHRPIHQALVDGRTDITLPARFGLADVSHEPVLHDAVARFIQDAQASREFAAANSADARFNLLFSDIAITPQGNAFDDYFAFAATD